MTRLAGRYSQLQGMTGMRRGPESDLRQQLSAPPLRVFLAEALLESRGVNPRGHDLHSHITTIVFQHDRSPGGDVLNPQHSGTAGQEMPGVVKCVKPCSHATEVRAIMAWRPVNRLA